MDVLEMPQKRIWSRTWRVITGAKTSWPPLLIMYAIMVIFFASMSENYLTVINFKSIMSNLPVLGIASIGMAVTLLTGGLDLSIGSIIGLAGVVLARFFNIPGKEFPLPLIITVGILVGPIIGAINGFLVVKVGINPVITTLGTMAIVRGLCYIYATQVARIFDPVYLGLSRIYLFNVIPISLVYMLVLMGILALILKFTKFGRNMYAVGGNAVTARLAGINVNRIKFMAYVISGLMGSIAAVVLTGQIGMGRPEFGVGTELEAITVVLLGGVSLAGGRGDFLGVLLGLLIFGSIGNGMVLLDVPIYWRQVAKGLILIVAVSIDLIRRRKSRK